MCVILFYIIATLQTSISISDGDTWSSVYKNETLTEMFKTDRPIDSQCHQSPTYTTFLDKSIFFFNNTRPASVSIANLSNPLAISPTFGYEENKSFINLKYNCNGSMQNQWSYVTIEYHTDISNVSFQILKICGEQPRFDIGYLLLNAMVILVLLVSIVKTQSFIDSSMVTQGNNDEQPVTVKYAFMIVVFGSMLLMALFFLSEITTVILTVILSFSSLIGTSFVIYLFLLFSFRKYTKIIEAGIKLPIVGRIHAIDFVSYLISAALVIFYLITKDWILNNIIAISVAFYFLQHVKLPKLKIGAVLFIATMIYDVFWVFISDYIFTKSVMVSVATKIDLPIKICMPHLSYLPLKDCSLIGLGDLIIPGIVMSYATEFSLRKGTSLYYTWSIISYLIGLILCDISLYVFMSGQPALIYLCPCVFIAVTIVALKRKEFKELWNGPPVSSGTDIELQENIENM